MNIYLSPEKIELLKTIFVKKYNGFTKEEIEEVQELTKDVSFEEMISFFEYLEDNDELIKAIGENIEEKLTGIIGSKYTSKEIIEIFSKYGSYSEIPTYIKFRIEKGLEPDYKLDYEGLINECIDKSKIYDVMGLYSVGYTEIDERLKKRVFEFIYNRKDELYIKDERVEPFIDLLKVGNKNGYDISTFWNLIEAPTLIELCTKEEKELLDIFYEKSSDDDKNLIDAFRKLNTLTEITEDDFKTLFSSVTDQNKKRFIAQYAVKKGYVPSISSFDAYYFSDNDTKQTLINANLVYYLLTKDNYESKYATDRIYEGLNSEEAKLAFNALKDYKPNFGFFFSIPKIYYELEDILKVENIPKYFDEEGIKPELLYELFKRTKVEYDNNELLIYFLSKGKDRLPEEDKIYCEFIETVLNSSSAFFYNRSDQYQDIIKDRESFNAFINDDERIIELLKSYYRPEEVLFGLLRIDRLNDNVINNTFNEREKFGLDVLKNLLMEGVEDYSFLSNIFRNTSLYDENGIKKDKLINYMLENDKIDIAILLNNNYITEQQREFLKAIKPVFDKGIESEKLKVFKDAIIDPEILNKYIIDNKVTVELIDRFFELGCLECVEGYEHLLTDKKKVIYEVYKSIENDELKKVYSEFIESSLSSILTGTIPEDTIRQIPELLDLIKLSNSSEVAGRYINVARLILQNTNESKQDPIAQFKKIEKIFLTRELSHMDKIFRSFQLLYPHKKLIETIKRNHHSVSPTLYKYATSPEDTILGKEALRLHKDGTYAVEMLMYADLLKTTIASNDKTFIDYIDNIEKGNQVFIQLMTGEKSIYGLTANDKYILNTYVYHLETLYNRNNLSRPIKMTNDLNRNLEILMSLYKDEDLSLIPDRIIKSNYYAYLGIDTMEKIKTIMANSRRDAISKGYEYAKVPMKLEKGDIIKGIGGIAYFDTIIQNGSVSKEFLGGDVDSDLTPFDTDLSVILETKSTNDASRMGIDANSYGPIFFVIKDALGKYNCTRDNERDDFTLDETTESFSKIEIFKTLGTTHFGIRTGFATTQVDYICCEDKYLIDKIGLVLAKNGIYIPVVGKEGNLLFSPEEYEYLRGKMAGLSQYGIDSFDVSKTASNEFTQCLIGPIRNNIEQTAELKHALEEKLRVGFAASGLTMKTQIDGDMQPGSVELIDTGSTGRGTNQIGDGDFDFTIRIDRVLSMNTEQQDQVVSKVYEELGIGPRSGDIRKEKVSLGDKEVELDISYAQKSDRITYTTDMSLTDRLETIRRQDPEQHLVVLSNIVLAKTLLKKGECYKPHHASENAQGGLGGVGTENWILQNGGSLEDAATEFLIAAGIMRIEEKEDGTKEVVIDENTQKQYDDFKTTYSIWDFGQNQLSEKRSREFPYDNFIWNNMNQKGYMKMAKTMQTYLLELHPEFRFEPRKDTSSLTEEEQVQLDSVATNVKTFLHGLKPTNSYGDFGETEETKGK